MGVGVGVPIGVAVGVGVGVEVAVGVAVGVGEGVGPLYSSALVLMVGKSDPPAASAIPLDSNVAVCRALALLRLPVTAQAPLAGSYSSALAKAKPLVSKPAAASVVPLDNRVAECP
jgi:hypothetical protein